jgi:transcriptional regulator GlxA family with amidase domain
VTIVFKSLGVNHFIRSPFKDITKEISQEFLEWNSPEYNLFMDRFFFEDNLKERTQLIESFPLTQIHSFDSEKVLRSALKFISNLENDASVQDLAESLNISIRTLNRLFETNLGISPATYKKVLRFRLSLNMKLFNNEFKRLTKIGYEKHFYDPSYFNKIYKD